MIQKIYMAELFYNSFISNNKKIFKKTSNC